MSQNILTNTTTPPLAGSTAIGVLNQAVDSLAKWYCGTAAPSASAAGLANTQGFVWHDTATNTLKVRDQADATWIIVGYFDETGKTFTPHLNGAQVYAADTGSANAYAVALTPAWSAYVTGLPFYVLAANTNTGASTINVNALGTKALVRRDGSALKAGDITASAAYPLIYDGTAVRMLATPFATGAQVIAGTDAVSAVTAASLTTQQSVGANGHVTLPGGVIIQWGTTASIPANTVTTQTLPFAFPNALFMVTCTRTVSNTTVSGGDKCTPFSASTFGLTNNGNQASTFGWIAIGN